MTSRNIFFKRLFFVFTSTIIAILFSLSVVAKGEIPSPSNPHYENAVFGYNDHPVYLYKFKNGNGTLHKLPRMNRDANVEVLQIANNKILLRCDYIPPSDFEGIWYGDAFNKPVILDINTMKYSDVPLEQYQGQHYMLASGHIVNKTPMGIYQLFDPETYQKTVKLQMNYGKKLELPNFAWGQYDLYYSKRFDFRTYVSNGLEYSPQSKQYILLYCLSPYYGTDGSKLNKMNVGEEDEIPWNNSVERNLRVAIFDKNGRLVKKFSLPGVVTGSHLIANEFTEGTFTQLSGSGNWDHTPGTPILFSSLDKNKIIVEAGLKGNEEYTLQTILIDLKKESYKIPTKEDIKNFNPALEFTETEKGHYNVFINKQGLKDYRNTGFPFKVEYAETGTYLKSKENNSVLHYLNGRYETIYTNIDSDGTAYAFFAVKDTD